MPAGALVRFDVVAVLGGRVEVIEAARLSGRGAVGRSAERGPDEQGHAHGHGARHHHVVGDRAALRPEGVEAHARQYRRWPPGERQPPALTVTPPPRVSITVPLGPAGGGSLRGAVRTS